MSGLDASSFVVFDFSAFPVVTVNNDAIVAGYAARWTSENFSDFLATRLRYWHGTSSPALLLGRG
ncbi:hypothetical protein ACN262_28555 [Burkholderia gladioli]|uniref:hypothetical protein n=1 Tax=Burkholderia gladioli TaxID=28095 RepID=UPI001640F75D|nr:hypothetical protein [Burkholderia gladioli]